MWFGAMRVDSGEMPIGNLTAFLQYLMQILFTVLMAVFMFIFVPRAAVSAGGSRRSSRPSRPCAIRRRPVPLAPVEGDGAKPTAGRPIEFRDVEFRYPGAQDPVLRDVSFVARAGRDGRHRGLDRQRQVDARST